MRALRMLVLPMLAAGVLLLPAGAVAAEPARPADAFVDSIGVNVHMTYGDTAYRNRELLIDALSNAGIRHVRDGLSHDTDYAYESFNELARRGIRTTFIMGDPSERRDTLEQLLAELRSKLTRAAEAVEGPNEYSYSGDPDWAANLRAYQRRLRAAIEGDPALSHLPVLAPSLISWQDHAQLGDMRDALDLGNKHSYPGGDLPEGNLGEELSVAARVSGDRPVWVTESGYHNAVASGGGHRPASEAATATYLPRMYLEYFRRGVERTFAYELVDEWPDARRQNQEANFGLLRNDYSPKPAFTRLSNLIAVLSDPGPRHAVDALELSVDGPADLRRVVLQKRDGSYYVVLWRAVRVWDPVTSRPLGSETAPVTLRLGPDSAGRMGSAELIYPAAAATPFAKNVPSDDLRLAVGADPLVVRFVPATSSGAAPPSVPDAEPAIGTAPPAPQLSVVAGQRLRSVLRRGLLVRCTGARRKLCKITAAHASADLASGKLTLGAAGAAALRLRPTASGAARLRRAAVRRRPLTVTVRAVVGGRAVTKRAVLKP